MLQAQGWSVLSDPQGWPSLVEKIQLDNIVNKTDSSVCNSEHFRLWVAKHNSLLHFFKHQHCEMQRAKLSQKSLDKASVNISTAWLTLVSYFSYRKAWQILSIAKTTLCASETS